MNKAIINIVIWAAVILAEAMIVSAGKGTSVAFILIPVLLGMIVSLIFVTEFKTIKKDTDSVSK